MKPQPNPLFRYPVLSRLVESTRHPEDEVRRDIVLRPVAEIGMEERVRV